VATLLVGACTGGDEPGDEPGGAEPPATSSPSATDTPAEDEPATMLGEDDPEATEEPEPAPRKGECRLLQRDDVAAPTDDTRPVRCRQPHTAQTFHVGRVPADVVGDRAEPDTEAIAGYVTPRCNRLFARWIGGDRDTRILSRLHSVWFLPDDEDLALGARWFRCDAVAYGSGDEPARLPADVAGALDGDDALGDFGLCSEGSPEREDSVLLMCDRRRHDWRAFAVQRLEPGRRDSYPSRQARRQARRSCSDAAREELDFPLEWRYGWQPPSRRAWSTGVRHGLCWVPVR
jgi:hypothetical protein